MKDRDQITAAVGERSHLEKQGDPPPSCILHCRASGEAGTAGIKPAPLASAAGI